MKLSEYIKEFGDKQVDVDKLSEFIIEDKVFEPKENERYYFISSDGVTNYSLNNHKADRNKINYQQVYRTEEEAEFAREEAIFLEFMRKEFLRNSDELDWLEGDCYCMAYDFTYKEVVLRYNAETKTSLFNTNNYGWLKEFIDEHYDEIKKYYFEIKGEN